MINKITLESWKLTKNILSDTLKVNGKYSSKRIMSFVSFNTAVLMAWLEMISKYQYKANVEIILLLLSIAGYNSALTIYSNKNTEIEKS